MQSLPKNILFFHLFQFFSLYKWNYRSSRFIRTRTESLVSDFHLVARTELFSCPAWVGWPGQNRAGTPPALPLEVHFLLLLMTSHITSGLLFPRPVS